METFAQLPILSFRPGGEIFNKQQLLRFLVAYAPRNDIMQRFQMKRINMNDLRATKLISI